MRKVKKYNHGFTLVEMITTITILGVVSLIALPVINGVSNGFTEQKFSNYEESLLTSAKLYVDQNLEDLFGYSDDGCVDVKFSEIHSKALLEDIDVEGASCNSPNTFVRVHKNGSSYNYEVSVSCTMNDNVVYEKTLANDTTCQPIGTDPEAGEIPGGYVPISTAFSSDLLSSTNPEKSKTVTILVSDEKGFAPNAKIRYWWINTSNGNAIVGGKKEIDFKNALIKNSHTLRKQVTTPSGITGDLKLHIEAINVITSDGRQITGYYESDGIFRVDNTAPTVNIKAYYYNNNTVGDFVKKADNSDLVISDWKNTGYYFDFSSSTDNYTGYNFSKQTWKWNKTGNFNMVEDYQGGSSESATVQAVTFTGRGARYGTITLCDAAGNCASKNIKVNISTIYYINYSAGNGSGSTGKTTCYYGEDCKLDGGSGFSKTGHSFSKWNINGTNYDPGANVKNLVNTHEGSITATAQFNVNYYTVNYYVNDGVGYNGVWDRRSVPYGGGIDTSLNPQWSINEFRQFNWWDGVPGSMPDHDITVTASISDVYCQAISGYSTYNHVATFVPVFQNAGWSNVTIQHAWEPYQQYYMVVTSYNLTYWQAVNVAQYIWNNTPASGANYLVWMMYGCLNGRSYSMCRNWAC